MGRANAATAGNAISLRLGKIVALKQRNARCPQHRELLPILDAFAEHFDVERARNPRRCRLLLPAWHG